MGRRSYRVPVAPIVPGSPNDGKSFQDMESLPVHSIITKPANGTKLPAATRAVPSRGAAWAGDAEIQRVDVSHDFGQPWQATTLAAPKNRYAWVRWTHNARLPSDGYFELWVRVTSKDGRLQPLVAPNWNPQGYSGNPINRVAVLVGQCAVSAASSSCCCYPRWPWPSADPLQPSSHVRKTKPITPIIRTASKTSTSAVPATVFALSLPRA